MHPAPTPVSRIEFANALRGIAALSVMVSHYLGGFWMKRDAVATLINAPALPSDGFPTPPVVSAINATELFQWGPFGVALFFLISGFVIPLSFERYDWKGFLAGRFFRLYPTYAAGFSLTLIAIYGAGARFGAPFPYGFEQVAIHYLIGLRDLLWSPNIDGIVWTLEIEVRFYLVCALIAVWLKRGSRMVFLAPALVALGCFLAAPFMPGWLRAAPRLYYLGFALTDSFQFLLYMFIGVAFSQHYRRRLSLAPLVFAVALLFSLFAGAWRVGPLRGLTDQLWSYALALAVFALAYARSSGWARNRALAALADISYPLYVIHGVAGYAALRLLLDAGMSVWPAVLLVTLAALGMSWVLHRWIEMPTHRLGRALAGRLSARAAVAAGAVPGGGI